MLALDVVVFKWGDRYRWEYVERLRRQVAQHLSRPHRFTVVTDDTAAGRRHMGERARVLPLLHPEWVELGNAYPKLEIFAPYFPADRVLMLDLDVSIVGSLDELVSRPEPLVIAGEFDYAPRRGRRGKYNTSVVVLTVGAAPCVYERFARDPEECARAVKRSGVIGSDQAFLSIFWPTAVTFTAQDGVRSYRFDVRPNGRRATDKIIAYHGKPKPWELDESRANR